MMTLSSETTSWALSTSRLRVRVAKPGFLYQRTRFDWTAIVTDILLDNQHTFCSVESPNPLVGAGGIGLMSEFGIHEPIGFDEADVGEKFPKLGVGLLEKPDNAAYFFMRPYPVAPFPCTVTILDDGLRFGQAAVDCRGYAANLTKTLTLRDTTLRVDFLLENTGKKRIETTEYNHNFLQLNGKPTGADYRFTSSAPLHFTRNDGSTWSTDGILTWPDGIQAFHAHCGQLPEMDQFSWTLRHRTAGISVTGQVDFKPCRVACWGMEHVISPEIFFPIRLSPGESAAWSRQWTFQTA